MAEFKLEGNAGRFQTKNKREHTGNGSSPILMSRNQDLKKGTENNN